MRHPGAAAAADDAGAGIECQAPIVGHQRRRAVVADRAFDPLRDAAVGLGHQPVARLRRFSQAEKGCYQFRGAGAAIGTVGGQRYGQIVSQRGPVRRGDAHHGAPVGVEGESGNNRQAGSGGAFDGSADLFDAGKGLDPQQVGTAVGQGLCLLCEGGDAGLVLQRSQGNEEIACWADRAGYQDLPAGRLYLAAQQFGGRAIDLIDAVLGLMQL